MTKILEFRKPKITVNPALNGLDTAAMFPEKLAHATAVETLCPISSAKISILLS